MRQPSTTTSCVAEPKATRKAKTAVTAMFGLGVGKPDPDEPDRDEAWQVSIQARRRPTSRDSTGTSKASTSGDHRNLKL